MDQQATEQQKDAKAGASKKNGKEPVKRQAPAGFVKAKAELEAYWDPDDGPVYCILHSYKAFDSNMQKTKTATLITAELLEDTILRDPDDKDVKKTYPSGTTFGIWGKPGLKEAKQHAKVPVFIEYVGDKDTGKGNPMKLFEVSYDPKNPGEKLICTEDQRNFSLPADVKDARSRGVATTSLEDIPF